jgi:hypothetical protein
MKIQPFCRLLAVSFAMFQLAAAPLGTGFTYQGRLTDGGLPANGSYDLRVLLFDAESGGAQVGTTVTQASVAVAAGVFSTVLDFGAGVFDGSARWLEIGVRPAGGGAYTTLTPRQPLTAAPYALFAATGNPGPAGPQGPEGDVGPVGATGAAGPQGPQGVRGLTFKGAWSSGANYVTDDTVRFNGTSWLAKRANNNVSPTEGADWTVLAQKGDTGAAGAPGPAGVAGSAGPIGPAGATGPQGLKGDTGLTGAQGPQGMAGPKGDTGATGPQGLPGVAGPIGPQGLQGLTGATGATGATGPAGPEGLKWRGAWSALTAYGIDDAVTHNGSAWMAKLASTGSTPVEGGENWDLLAMKGDTGATGPQGLQGPQGLTGATGPTGPQGPAGSPGAAGPVGPQGPQGLPGSADAWSLTGSAGTIQGIHFLGTTDSQPLEVRVNGMRASLLMPTVNDADHQGIVNVINGAGVNSVSPGVYGATIGGGGAGIYLGGVNPNSVTADFGTVSGGLFNRADGLIATVGGGSNNTSSGNFATVPGGFQNLAQGHYSFAAGHGAKAQHPGSFVWADAQGADFASTADNQFLIRAAGFVGINNNNPATALDVNGIVTATGFSGNGAGLTSLNAANLTGTVPVASVPADVSLLGPTIESSELTDGTILDSDIHPAAGIMDTKLATIATAGKVANSATTATPANMPNSIVARDGTGNFIAGLIYSSGLKWTGQSELHGEHGGSIELGNSVSPGAMPYIDFHYGIGSEQSYNVRLMNTADGVLTAFANLQVTGSVNAVGFTGNGSGLTQLNAVTLDGLNSSGFWRTAGNASTTPGVNFIGTTDNQALELKVNNTRALRLEPTVNDADHAGIVNVIQGAEVNSVPPGVYGATIAGGGAANLFGFQQANSVTADFGTVGGGSFNAAGGNSATVGGGSGNTASGGGATVGGGSVNTASSGSATVGGGNQNTASGSSATVGGGFDNTASGSYATVGGGEFNTVSGHAATVPGGAFNAAVGAWSFAAGRRARAFHEGAFVWADSQNPDFASTSVGQFSIRANGGVRIVGGSLAAGIELGDSSAVGQTPYLDFHYGTGADQDFNVRLINDGDGRLTCTGNLAFGTQIRQMLNLWNTAYGIGVQHSRLYFRADAGFAWYLGGVHHDDTDNAGGGTQLMQLTSSGLTVNGTFVSASDRNAKEDFRPLDTRAVLDKVAALPLSEWSYQADEQRSRHIGPMAQDFKAAFGLGADDRHIATVDADGVALAAIQGLNQKLEERLREKDIKIAALERSIGELKELVETLARKEGGVR